MLGPPIIGPGGGPPCMNGGGLGGIGIPGWCLGGILKIKLISQTLSLLKNNSSSQKLLNHN